MILWRLAQRSNLDSSVPFHKVFELSYSAVSQWLSVYNKARVAWVPLTYSDKKHSPPTDKGYNFRQLATLRSSTQFLAWVTRWCLMGSWFYIRVQSKHQHGQVQPCCQLKSCVCVCSKPSLSQWFTVLISLDLVSLARSLYLLMLWSDLTWGHINQMSLFLLTPTQDVLEITAKWMCLCKPDFFLWQLWKMEIFNPNI